MPTPEELARQSIDAQLGAAGWVVQSLDELNLSAARGVAVREMQPFGSPADYILFFERKAASEMPWPKDLWIYDLRTNQRFTLKTNPLANKDLEDFKAVYQTGAFAKRKETDRFKRFTYDEIVARDKANLDILWLKDESLEDSDNLPAPAPALLATEIVESLEAALAEFRAVEEALLTEN